jgi:hypothetical protein
VLQVAEDSEDGEVEDEFQGEEHAEEDRGGAAATGG